MYFQRFGGAWRRQLPHLVVVGMKSERDERLEAAGLVLQRARPQHVIDALAGCLDVAIQHRDVGLHPEAMGNPVNIEVTIGAALVMADLLADALGKDFRPSTRQ